MCGEGVWGGLGLGLSLVECFRVRVRVRVRGMFGEYVEGPANLKACISLGHRGGSCTGDES